MRFYTSSGRKFQLQPIPPPPFPFQLELTHSSFPLSLFPPFQNSTKKTTSLSDIFIDPTCYPPIRSGLLVVDVLPWDVHPVSFEVSSFSSLLKLPLIRRQIRPDHSPEDEDHCDDEGEWLGWRGRSGRGEEEREGRGRGSELEREKEGRERWAETMTNFRKLLEASPRSVTIPNTKSVQCPNDLEDELEPTVGLNS